jgi:ATP synthase protein I
MSRPEETREEALRRLDERANALEKRTTRTTPDYGAQAAEGAYRLMAELIGGVLVGLGLGAGFDFLVKSAPWGMIVGVLTGFAISIWIAVRSAQRMSARAAKEWGPPQDLPPEDDEED